MLYAILEHFHTGCPSHLLKDLQPLDSRLYFSNNTQINRQIRLALDDETIRYGPDMIALPRKDDP
jgi:hypothetical protein